MRTEWIVGGVVSVAFIALPGLAQEEDGGGEKVKEVEASLQYAKGKVTVGKDLAELDVPEEFRFLGAKDARTVLEDIWGNPKDTSVLGMIVPRGFRPTGDGQWAMEIKYEAEGYVKDDDAASLDFDQLLRDMQEGTREDNAARKNAGYPAVELVGWATKPRYDSAQKKLYWAKELRFSEDESHTLNYNIRILGRRGVLLLNAIGGMDSLAQIEEATPRVLSFVNFKAGNRYEDFDPSIDKVAAYGIGGLIAGKLALKAGLLKGLWLAILAGKKFVIIGLVAVGAVIAKVLGRKKRAEA